MKAYNVWVTVKNPSTGAVLEIENSVNPIQAESWKDLLEMLITDINFQHGLEVVGIRFIKVEQ